MLDLYQYGGLVIAIICMLTIACVILMTIVYSITKKYFLLKSEYDFECNTVNTLSTVNSITSNCYDVVCLMLDDIIHSEVADRDYKISMLRSVYTILELKPEKIDELKHHLVLYGDHGTNLRRMLAYTIEKNQKIITPNADVDYLNEFYDSITRLNDIKIGYEADTVKAKNKVLNNSIHKKLKKDVPEQITNNNESKSIFETEADCVAINYSDKTKSYLDGVVAELDDFATHTD